MSKTMKSFYRETRPYGTLSATWPSESACITDCGYGPNAYGEYLRVIEDSGSASSIPPAPTSLRSVYLC